MAGELVKRLKDISKALSGLGVSVGLQGEGGAKGRATDAELVMIGAVHENGIGVPQRPFLAQATAADGPAWAKIAVKVAAKVAQGDTAGAERGLKVLGEVMVKDVQSSIKSGKFEKLAPSTIARKGSPLQLFETGQMHDSIRAAVTQPDGSKALIA